MFFAFLFFFWLAFEPLCLCDFVTFTFTFFCFLLFCFFAFFPFSFFFFHVFTFSRFHSFQFSRFHNFQFSVFCFLFSVFCFLFSCYCAFAFSLRFSLLSSAFSSLCVYIVLCFCVFLSLTSFLHHHSLGLLDLSTFLLPPYLYFLIFSLFYSVTICGFKVH